MRNKGEAVTVPTLQACAGMGSAVLPCDSGNACVHLLCSSSSRDLGSVTCVVSAFGAQAVQHAG